MISEAPFSIEIDLTELKMKSKYVKEYSDLKLRDSKASTECNFEVGEN